MDNLITNINTLVSEKSLSQADIEIALQVKLIENKKAGNPEMKIFESSLWTSVSLYKVELRVYNQGAKYFLLVYPDKPVTIKPADIKQVFDFIAFNPPDERRQEPAEYRYEKNDHSIRFYYDEPGKKVIMVSLEGTYNSNEG